MNQDVLIALIAALAGGGLIGGIVAWRKAGPERDSIMISTAQLIVGMSREEVDRLDQQNERLANRLAEVEHDLGKKILDLEAERDALKAENAVLQKRVQRLERTNGIGKEV